MDLSLNEQQLMLKTMGADFLKQQLPKERVRQIDESPTGFDPDLWRDMAELGWTSMVIPEEYGGMGMTFADLGVLYEVMGEAACSSPNLSSAVLSAQAILHAGDAEQKNDLLPAIASGEQIFAFAYTEPDYSWEADGVRLSAAKRDGSWTLNGTKLFVPDAHVADRLLVAARTSDNGAPEQGITLFLVEKDAPGVSVRLLSGWIGDKVCEITLENAAASAVIGAVDEGWAPIEHARDRGTAVLCAYMAGGARTATQMALEYSNTRIAFGVPIGTFQRVQDHVIEGTTNVDSIQWTAYEALWKIDEGRADAPLSVSMAKAVASVAFPAACEASHHVHAGIGTDLDFGLVHYTKRARTFQSYLGDATYHKKRAARLMNLGSGGG